MDLERAMGQISVVFITLRIYYTRYLKAFIIGDIIGPLIGGLGTYLTGKFVGSVIYAGHAIPYATFIVVGTVSSFVATALIYNFLIKNKSTRLTMIFFEHPLLFPVARTINILPIAFVAAVFWALPICLAEGIPIYTPTFLYLLGTAVLTPVLGGIGLLFTALSFYIRGRDFSRLYNMGLRVVRLLVPTSFAASAFGAAKGIALFVPTVAAMEGIRMVTFGIPGGIPLLAYAVFSGLAVFIIGYAAFIYTLNLARRKGWIMLE